VLSLLKSQQQSENDYASKIITRNLCPVIQESFKDFSKVIAKIQKDEKTSFFSTIKEETIMALVEILNLSQVDVKLIEVLSGFMLQFSDKNEHNWNKVREYCEALGLNSLSKMNNKLSEIMEKIGSKQTDSL
jgi:hypothetical protein